jgi:hypothetical protein
MEKSLLHVTVFPRNVIQLVWSRNDNRGLLKGMSVHIEVTRVFLGAFLV